MSETAATPSTAEKAAIVANTDSNHIFLDGHNNPGFSGGPVFVVNESNHHVTVIGIISGYIPQKSPVKDDSGNDVFLNVNGTAKRVFSQENSGIIKAVQIHEAIAVI